MTDKPVQTLEGIHILSGLAPADRQALGRRCRWRRFGAGEQIIDRETDSQDVYFVVAGLARVVNFAANGREVSFDDIAAGGYFGEMAALDGMPRSASVMAIEETQAASLPGPTFVEMIKDHPSASLAIMQRLTAMLRRSTGRIMDLSTLGANNRVFAELLRLAKPQGAGPAGRAQPAVIRPVPHHADIAARVSTTRETVARAVSDLVRLKVLKREKGALVVLDSRRLSDMVQEFRHE